MRMTLHALNAFLLDAVSTFMLGAFAVEAVVRVYAMTKSAIRRALKSEDQ